MIVFCLALLILGCQTSNLSTITINNTQILDDSSDANVVANGVLNGFYDDTTYNDPMKCKNGQLQLINDTYGNNITFIYSGLDQLKESNISVEVSPNTFPLPSVELFANNSFTLLFNCLPDINSDNWGNKINVYVGDMYKISFLLDCDPYNSHKNFQFGYIIIGALNGIILLGVAMHSRIWSIKFNNRGLRVDVRWVYILVACVIGVILIAAFYLVAFINSQVAFVILRYGGIAVSTFFVFICFNESFYLFRKLRVVLYKLIRYCQVISFFCTIGLILTSLFIENWILYNIMAICICVASIKLFHFQSLREAYLTMGIYVITVTALAVALYFILSKSYNDYATELSSPLFLEVPQLVNDIYKKCSWLPVIDIIFPGVTLAYLRLYDENQSSRWGGIYTVSGNITVILSTILWVGIEALYPFTVPFSLVTYIALMIVIFLIAWKRNNWFTLYKGNFVQEREMVDHSKMTERHQSFSVLIDQDVLQPLKKIPSSSSQSKSRISSDIRQP